MRRVSAVDVAGLRGGSASAGSTWTVDIVRAVTFLLISPPEIAQPRRDPIVSWMQLSIRDTSRRTSTRSDARTEPHPPDGSNHLQAPRRELPKARSRHAVGSGLRLFPAHPADSSDRPGRCTRWRAGARSAGRGGDVDDHADDVAEP